MRGTAMWRDERVHVCRGPGANYLAARSSTPISC